MSESEAKSESSRRGLSGCRWRLRVSRAVEMNWLKY